MNEILISFFNGVIMAVFIMSLFLIVGLAEKWVNGCSHELCSCKKFKEKKQEEVF